MLLLNFTVTQRMGTKSLGKMERSGLYQDIHQLLAKSGWTTNSRCNIKVMGDNYQLASSGETLVEPTGYKPKFDGTEWIASKKPDPQPTSPTLEQQMVMRQQAQIAQLSKSNKQLQQLVMNQQAAIIKIQKAE